MPDEPADDNTQDISVYDLAERVIAGRHVSEAGHREIAAELIKLRAELDDAHERLDACCERCLDKCPHGPLVDARP